MVHALKKVASRLTTEGVILEVHDLIEPPRIEVHSVRGQFFAGQLLSSNYFENERKANLAINQAVAEGLLKSDQSIIFEYFIRADSFSTLSNWLAEEWPNEYIPDDTRWKVMEMESEAAEHAEVVLRIASRLNLFRATN